MSRGSAGSPAPSPPARLPTTMVPSRDSATSPQLLAARVMTWNTSTASTAPSGSMTMLSHFKVGPVMSTGRMWQHGRDDGGAGDHEDGAQQRGQRPIETQDPVRPNALKSQVASAPMVSRRVITPPTSRSSLSERLKPPSNRMSATDSETRGYSRLPNNSSGWRKPVTGPARMPNTSNSRMEGSRSRQPSHWAEMPSTATAARLSR